MAKVVGMVPNEFTNGGGAANEIDGKDFKLKELKDGNQEGQTEQRSTWGG